MAGIFDKIKTIFGGGQNGRADGNNQSFEPTGRKYSEKDGRFEINTTVKEVEFTAKPDGIHAKVYEEPVHDSGEILTCSICGDQFIWSDEEKQWAAEKGFQNAPSKCKKCRTAVRSGAERPMFNVVCSACGKELAFPFKPVDDRPVYCNACYAQRKSGGSEQINPENTAAAGEGETLVCSVCGKNFIFTIEQQEFYKKQGYTKKPGKCPECRSFGRSVNR